MPVKIPTRNLMSLLGLAIGAYLAQPALAHQYNFLVRPSVETAGSEAAQSIDFSVYLDPMKTNWIAWSQYESSQMVGDMTTIDDAYAGNTGIADVVKVTLTDPNGNVSREFLMDQNDDAGRSSGPQAVVFGNKELTPNVVRTDYEGNISLFDEDGPANEFVKQGGAGYYTVHFDFKNAAGKPIAPKGMYVLMDVVEGFRFPDPVFYQPTGGFPFGFNDTNHNNNDDDDDDNGNGRRNNPPEFPTPTPTPYFTPTPVPTPDPHNIPLPNNPFPNLDDDGIPPDDDEPVVPEPATLALTGLGLAGLGWMRRKARRQA